MSSQRSVPAPFLSKTYQLVDDSSTDDIISWNENGTAFVVWKTAEFAKDLLPNYFKHNNFSSFVRQLNTYGFRKAVPDKWEFANENFKRGEIELLTKIYRRKSMISTPASGKYTGAVTCTTPASSGEDIGSSSTSSPDSKNPGLATTSTATGTQFSDLTGENERLRKENQTLSVELAHAKKQCEDLVHFLTHHVKVLPEEISRVVSQETMDRSGSVVGGGNADRNRIDYNDDNDDKNNKKDSLKLFGVSLKRKMEVGESAQFSGTHGRETKRIEFSAPWMKNCWVPSEGSKVCN